LRHEWEQRQQELNSSALETVPTVFFGGGTPSLFSPEAIGGILQDLTRKGPAGTEVTLELNPKTANRKKLKEFKEVGINRISMGLQSLDDFILAKLGRAHSGREALESLTMVLETGFDGVNVDIMYGLPYQNLKVLEQTLEGLDSFPLGHLSAYELILEDHTPFYGRYRYDVKPLPDSQVILQMHAAIDQFAREKGMALYEISNWSKPGEQCRHNLHYWNYESFLGLGAGAVSFLRWDELGSKLQGRWGDSQGIIPYGLRWTNVRQLKKYLESPDELKQETMEWISQETAQAEFMMMGLRKARGIRYRNFQEKFQVPLPQKFFQGIERSVERGWLQEDGEGIYLTHLGRQFSNEVMQEFI
jgi:oxygen-independent coproporphyrinogen-3 oxidase